MTRSKRRHLPALPVSFVAKKNRILEEIAVPVDVYTDKSPKGSIDTPIRGLIDELNSIEGIVTTSSCSGRVAVFVEGPKPGKAVVRGSTDDRGQEGKRFQDGGGDGDTIDDDGSNNGDNEATIKTGSPAGKGGGHWLYVSHDPVHISDPISSNFFTELCGLDHHQHGVVEVFNKAQSQRYAAPRLIKLSFSPLILHVLCATPQHAKPLLAAAISAGFRESGVQSLRALDEPDAGVMVGIRTMGLGFDTVIGIVHERQTDRRLCEVTDRSDLDEQHHGISYRSIVDENHLSLMFRVVNERFEWNVRRKERLIDELRTHFELLAKGGRGIWEDKDTRAKRKKEEGLKRQQEKKETIEEQARLRGDDLNTLKSINDETTLDSTEVESNSENELEHERGDAISTGTFDIL